MSSSSASLNEEPYSPTAKRTKRHNDRSTDEVDSAILATTATMADGPELQLTLHSETEDKDNAATDAGAEGMVAEEDHFITIQLNPLQSVARKSVHHHKRSNSSSNGTPICFRSSRRRGLRDAR